MSQKDIDETIMIKSVLGLGGRQAMPTWKTTKTGAHYLEVGPLGKLLVVEWVGKWMWEWRKGFCIQHERVGFASPASARRAAESWLRSALKRAQKLIA
jgi:hypothetical protein